MKQTGYIGDIHGSLRQLEEVVAAALPIAIHLVFLGDYVNRGSESREVIDFLIALKESNVIECTFLQGNHDKAFLSALNEGDIDDFLRIGGAATVQSYVPAPHGDVLQQLRKAVPPAHVDFLASLAERVTLNGVLATHMTAPGNKSLDGGNDGYEFVICGHSPTRSRVPVTRGREAFIDTGCGIDSDGRLTCYFWPSREWIQSST